MTTLQEGPDLLDLLLELLPPVMPSSVCSCGASVTPVPAGDEWGWVDAAGHRVTFVPTAGVLRWWRSGLIVDWEAMVKDDIVAYSGAQFDRGRGTAVLAHVHTGRYVHRGRVPQDESGLPLRLTPAGWRPRNPLTFKSSPRQTEDDVAEQYEWAVKHHHGFTEPTTEARARERLTWLTEQYKQSPYASERQAPHLVRRAAMPWQPVED